MKKGILKGAALCAALFLAACQTARTPGEGGGASTSAYGYLAEIRSANGLGKLVSDPQLEKAALQQAGYMARAGRMAHTTGWGKDFAARMKDNSVQGAAAENIAYGRMDMAKLFDIWMNSPGHRRNMLDPRFSRFGLAYVRGGAGSDQKYWALVMGR
ncbi:CAP domain-containing protein [Mesorhizobium sp. KR1-2]|uniref:CAP domain-containing protein n=1 Tax=Mesorhizobium sp. KR1-2 TaxID=3156609 RepID=UPI0032B467AD